MKVPCSRKHSTGRLLLGIILCSVSLSLKQLYFQALNSASLASADGPLRLGNDGSAIRPSNLKQKRPEVVRRIGDAPPVNWTLSDCKNIQLDIGVPVAGEDGKLFQLAANLGKSIEIFRQSVEHGSDYNFRLLLTRYPQDNETNAWHRDLQLASKVNSIVFIHVKDPFSRAGAMNLLHKHACQKDYCVFTRLDVDMEVGPGYLRNALAYVAPKKSMYFPIVWSEYRPSAVALVEAFRGPLPKYSEQKGLWRDFGYGMYALSGVDVLSYMMNETKFQGWGGEDNDFYKRASSRGMVIVRLREHHLVHRWHPKICRLGSTVQEEWYKTW